MADQEVCDQLVTLLVAGHETTATALAWTLELLVHHPAALDRLGDGSRRRRLPEGGDRRVAAAAPGRAAGGAAADRASCTSTGMSLPEGTDVTPAIWLAHTRADVYPEPFAFRPERFLDGAPPPGYAWVPFGGGVRRCLGAAFAEMEMRVALATMLSRRARRGGDARARARGAPQRHLLAGPRDAARSLGGVSGTSSCSSPTRPTTVTPTRCATPRARSRAPASSTTPTSAASARPAPTSRRSRSTTRRRWS